MLDIPTLFSVTKIDISVMLKTFWTLVPLVCVYKLKTKLDLADSEFVKGKHLVKI